MMKISGVIKRGNAIGETVHLTGDAEILGGCWIHADFILNGFNLLLTRGTFSGHSIDGIKQDSFVWQRKESLPIAIKIIAALDSGGGDALIAYRTLIEVIQGQGGDVLNLPEFLVAYDAALSTRNFTYSRTLLKNVAIAVMGEAWVTARTNEEIFTAAQSFILGKTKEQLLGQKTEVVEEWANG